jgi:hypothetical protein
MSDSRLTMLRVHGLIALLTTSTLGSEFHPSSCRCKMEYISDMGKSMVAAIEDWPRLMKQAFELRKSLSDMKGPKARC